MFCGQNLEKEFSFRDEENKPIYPVFEIMEFRNEDGDTGYLIRDSICGYSTHDKKGDWIRGFDSEINDVGHFILLKEEKSMCSVRVEHDSLVSTRYLIFILCYYNNQNRVYEFHPKQRTLEPIFSGFMMNTTIRHILTLKNGRDCVISSPDCFMMWNLEKRSFDFLCIENNIRNSFSSYLIALQGNGKNHVCFFFYDKINSFLDLLCLHVPIEEDKKRESIDTFIDTVDLTASKRKFEMGKNQLVSFACCMRDRVSILMVYRNMNETYLSNACLLCINTQNNEILRYEMPSNIDIISFDCVRESDTSSGLVFALGQRNSDTKKRYICVWNSKGWLLSLIKQNKKHNLVDMFFPISETTSDFHYDHRVCTITDKGIVFRYGLFFGTKNLVHRCCAILASSSYPDQDQKTLASLKSMLPEDLYALCCLYWKSYSIQSKKREKLVRTNG